MQILYICCRYNIPHYMFLYWFVQKLVGSSSRVYCLFAQPTISSVLVQLPSRDVTKWLNENIVIGCSSADELHTRDDKPIISCVNHARQQVRTIVYYWDLELFTALNHRFRTQNFRTALFQT